MSLGTGGCGRLGWMVLLVALFELLLLVRRKLLVLLIHVADVLLLVRWQALESLVALAHALALLGRELLEALHPFPELVPLGGAHARPVVGGVHQLVLAQGRQA